MPPWKEYQEEVATFFRSLSLAAETDRTLVGVRTSHDIDVLINVEFAGVASNWIVECKLWKRKVSKLHVLALREIVSDVGADKGILLSEAGFQSGAVEAAWSTNIRLSTLSELRNFATEELLKLQVQDLHQRIEHCNHRYWEIPKTVRIKTGLRFDPGSFGYSGNQVIALARDLVRQAYIGRFPFEGDRAAAFFLFGRSLAMNSAEDVVKLLQALVTELESKLLVGEEQWAQEMNGHKD